MRVRLAHVAATAAGALCLLAGPAVLGDVLARDGGGTAPASVQAEGEQSPPPVPAPAETAAAPPGRTDIPAVPAAPRPAPVGAAAAIAPSPPVAVSVPTIGVFSTLESLAVRADGSLASPTAFERAGWFAAGVEPGQPGPAVIAGHVDSQAGPAVFHRLGELAEGDEISVRRADGSSVAFQVTEVTERPKDEFPTEAVYGPAVGPELRLVTCSGPFDEASGHYVANLVVFAVLA